MNTKKTFKVKVDDKELELAVLKPNHKINQTAQLVYNRAWTDAVRPQDNQRGVLVRAQIEEVMREQKMWDDAKQERYNTALKRLLENEKKLAKGGIKLTEGKELAIQMRRDRAEVRSLLAERNELDQNSAESLAEQARFNYFVANCTVYNDTGKPYFKDVEDYLSRDSDPSSLAAAQAFGSLFYGLDDNYVEKLAENVFLKKYKLVDDDLHLVDSKGRKVDVQGRLVDEQGRLINEKGELVDSEGTLLNEDGTYKVEFSKFLDENGNPVD